MGDYSKINKVTLHDAMKTYGLSFTTNQLCKTLADKLTKHYNTKFNTADLLICDNCNFYSDGNRKCCPYCGEMFVSFDVGQLVVEKESRKEYRIESVMDNIIVLVGTKTNSRAEVGEKELLTSYELPSPGGEPEEDIVEEVVKEEEIVAEESVTEEKALITSPVMVENYYLAQEQLPTMDELYNLSFKELDNFIASRGRLVADSVYDLGVLLKVMKDSGKYTKCFSSFEVYVKTQHDIHRQCAYNYIKIVETFTRDDVKRLGVGISGRLARADEEIREAILEGNTGKGPVEGRTTRSIDHEIKTFREEKREENTPPVIDDDIEDEDDIDNTDVVPEPVHEIKKKTPSVESSDKKSYNDTKIKKIVPNVTICELKDAKKLFKGQYIDKNKCVIDFGHNLGIYVVFGKNSVDAIFTDLDDNGLPLES